MPDDLAGLLPRAVFADGEDISLARVAERADELCPMPEVVARVLEILEDPRCNATRVARVVERDQALCAVVLRMCNSSLYRGLNEIRDVRSAVARIGLGAVRDIALASSVMRRPPVAAEVLDRLRAQMITSAGCARIVSSYVDAVPTSAAFLCGLLIDVGRLALAVTTPVRYGELCEQAAISQAPIEVLERAWVGFTHAEAGALLAERWGFPPMVCFCIAAQHGLGEVSPEEQVHVWAAAVALLGAHLAAVLHEEVDLALGTGLALAEHPAQAILRLSSGVLDELHDECARARFEIASLFDL